MKEPNTMTVVCVYNILFANDIACSTVIEAVEKVKHSPLYKQKTKMYCNKVNHERHLYEVMLNKTISKTNHSFLANANDVMADEVNKHLEILYYSIKRELDKHKATNSDVLARLELARTMVSFSVVNVEKRIKELNQNGVRGSLIDYLSMNSLLKQMDNLMYTLNLPGIDMNTYDCKTCIEVIGRCLCDGELIAKAIAERDAA